ncbi:6-hydroxymethylpterin diphosphokinase MptE-like protein [Sulfurimonas sp. HSL-1716]|uniref:motility associated factor glycosyltransferase family protein n=1 Tax=Hydrocurvibacter sulfurireducens TaxID=3131937 RepID=UPI0031F8C2B2
MSIYEQNLQALLQVNIKVATTLFGLKTNEKFEVFVDKKDPLNINIASNKNGKTLYEGVPIRQTEEYLNSFMKEYQRYPYLYFFGMGNGVFYKALLQDETHRRIVIVEPEIEILFMALHFNDFSKELASGRLVILLAEDITFSLASEIFMHPESRLFSKTYQFHILLPFYESEYGELIIAINRMFLQAIEHAVRGIGNDSTDALIGLQHQIANAQRMVHTPTTLELIKKVKNSNTAVIVSTGPSLKKQLPLLKKIKEHVTLLCVDASLPLLEREGIKPDVVISIERVIETAKFYQETSKEFQENIVFVITSIAHPDLFKDIKAGTLQISMRPFGYTSYFEMPEYGYLGIGMSAANMAYEMMFHANFENCILIGQDLAYGADGSTHSEGHLYGIQERDKNKQRYMIPAYGGEGTVESTVIWRLFKNFFESDIGYANAKGIKTVNATEGGARIEGAVEMPFAEAIEKYVDFTHKKEQIKLTKPDEKTIEANVEKIGVKINEMLAYAIKIEKEVETTFLHVARECESIESVKEDERYAKLDYQALSNVMSEIDRIKEYFDDQKFANIFTDSTQAMILHQEIELAKIQVRNVLTDNDKRQKMIDWVLAHRYWLFSLAGMMQATIDAINMGIEMKIDFNTITLIRVYIEDEEIDLLHIDHSDEFMKNLADMKRLCINYILEDKFAHKVDKLKFCYSDEAKTFNVEVHLPSRSDGLFDKFMFVNSLEATLDKKRFVRVKKDEDDVFTVGLLPVEGIYENKEFIECIKEISKKFPKVVFKFICWTQRERESSEHLFFGERDFIRFIAPKSIYELYQEIDMFIYDLEKLEDKRFYAVRHILNSTQEVNVPQLKIDQDNNEDATLKEHINTINLAISLRYLQNMHIDVYIDDEKIDEIHKGGKAVNNIFDLKQLCIEYKPCEKYALRSNQLQFVYIDEDMDIMASLAIPSRDDENYNIFAFQNSLETTIDKERLENLYEKDAIGFLALEENLHDIEFTNYLKELTSRFPQATLKAFYFNDKQRKFLENIFANSNSKIEFLIPNDIYDIAQEVEIFSINYLANIEVGIWAEYYKLTKNLIKYNRNIYVSLYNNTGTKNTTLLDYNAADYESLQYKILVQGLSIGKDFVKKYNNNFWICIMEYYLKMNHIEYTFKHNKTQFDFSFFDIIDLVLKDKRFKDYMIKIRRLFQNG